MHSSRVRLMALECSPNLTGEQCVNHSSIDCKPNLAYRKYPVNFFRRESLEIIERSTQLYFPHTPV